MLDLKTSEQKLPIASFRFTPVISSAARLKDVISQFSSTVNTPSEMLSKIAEVSCKFIVEAFWFYGVKLESEAIDFNRFYKIVVGACVLLYHEYPRKS